MRRGRVADSHIRLRAPEVALLNGNIEWLEAQDLIDELGEEQIALTARLARLESAAMDRRAHPAIFAAFGSVQRAVGSVHYLRDALDQLRLDTITHSVRRAFMPEAPLADYLRGVYAWTHAVMHAMDDLVGQLFAGAPDMAAYRARVEQAKNFHFDELEPAIRRDLYALLDQTSDGHGLGRLGAAFNAILLAARGLDVRLDEPVAGIEAR